MRETWGFGHVMLGVLNQQSSQYIAGYVVKKMGAKGPQKRVPAFARMSRRPGIGAFAIPDVASVLMQYSLEGRPLPTTLRHGSTYWPLGRYLRRLLRAQVGLFPDASLEEKEAYREALRPVFEAAAALSVGAPQARPYLIKDAFRRANEQYALNISAKASILNRGSL